MFNNEFGGQISWLLPAALILLVGRAPVHADARPAPTARAPPSSCGAAGCSSPASRSASGRASSTRTTRSRSRRRSVRSSAWAPSCCGNAATTSSRACSWPRRCSSPCGGRSELLDRASDWYPWLRPAIVVGGIGVTIAILAWRAAWSRASLRARDRRGRRAARGPGRVGDRDRFRAALGCDPVDRAVAHGPHRRRSAVDRRFRCQRAWLPDRAARWSRQSCEPVQRSQQRRADAHFGNVRRRAATVRPRHRAERRWPRADAADDRRLGRFAGRSARRELTERRADRVVEGARRRLPVGRGDGRREQRGGLPTRDRRTGDGDRRVQRHRSHADARAVQGVRGQRRHPLLRRRPHHRRRRRHVEPDRGVGADALRRRRRSARCACTTSRRRSNTPRDNARQYIAAREQHRVSTSPSTSRPSRSTARR